jgi:NAD-dependent DNA ligase
MKDLLNYDGEDKVISSFEMKDKIGKQKTLLNVRSKIPSLDRLLDGFATGELIMLSGLTKNGKTLLAQTLTQSFAGQTWCVTGSFEHFNPRSLALEEIEKRGGRTTSAVTGKTTHLLAGGGAGSKLVQANKLGVKVVNEEVFLSLLEEEKPTKKSEDVQGEFSF